MCLVRGGGVFHGVWKEVRLVEGCNTGVSNDNPVSQQSNVLIVMSVSDLTRHTIHTGTLDILTYILDTLDILDMIFY